jgi:hypothetical protein
MIVHAESSQHILPFKQSRSPENTRRNPRTMRSDTLLYRARSSGKLSRKVAIDLRFRAINMDLDTTTASSSKLYLSTLTITVCFTY